MNEAGIFWLGIVEVCSGEPNRKKHTYHHGEIRDIGQVVAHALRSDYHQVVLMGYSMGGNMTLKYLIYNTESLDSRIKAAVVYSTPCHLEDSAREISRPENRFYEKRFIKKLRKKIEEKASRFPELKVNWADINDFSDFNQKLTLPVYGFKTEQEYYDQARTDHLLDKIQIPTLIVNALNDPMLAGLNYPYKMAEKSEYVFLGSYEKRRTCWFFYWLECFLYGKKSGGVLWKMNHTFFASLLSILLAIPILI